MKRIFIIAVLMLASLSSFAQSGKSIYEKYSDNENVSAVYISPAMFRMIGKLPEIKTEAKGVDLAPVISSLTGMYMLDIQNSSIGGSLYSDVRKFISQNQYELLLEAKDSGETMHIYTVGTEKTVTGFVMLAQDAEETTFICIEGKMNRSDLEKLLAEQMK